MVNNLNKRCKMAIPTYSSFSEKSNNFNILRIETIEDLVLNFGEKFDKLNGIFRGISKAKYKIYTSLQREYILENLDANFSIENYLENFKKDQLLSSYFNSLQIKLTKIAILSFLQHYQAPTPLIDFTKNLSIAIYFAIENYEPEDIFINENEIDNYFSIFYISSENTKLLSIHKIIEGFEEIDAKFQNIFVDKSRYEIEGVQYMDGFLERTLEKIYLIDVKNQYKIFSIENNIRILSQQGLFIHNIYEDKPLEVALKEFFIEATYFIGSQLDDIDHDERVEKINNEYIENLAKNRQIQSRLKENIITSYEININLIPEIIKLINIDRDKIYPNLEKISKEVFNNSNR